MSSLSYKRKAFEIDKHIDITNEDLLRHIIIIYKYTKNKNFVDD